jgi:hypothetical protein
MNDYLAERGVNYRYQMFSMAGNDACENAVQEIVAQVEAGKLSRKDLPQAVRKACNEIEKTYPEVYDTEPQGQFAYDLTKRVCEPQMWIELDRWDW